MKVVGVYVGDQRVASTSREEITFRLDGVEGDRHVGFTKRAGVREKDFHEKGTEIFNARQWSAVSVEELDQIAKAMGVPKLRAEWLGANLLFSGYGGLTQLLPLTRLVFSGGTVLLVRGENLPCRFPAEVMREEEPGISSECARLFPQAAVDRRGLVGWVERAGTVRPGDLVNAFLPYPGG